MKKTTKILMIGSLLIGAVAFGSTTASAKSHRHDRGHDNRQVEKQYDKKVKRHSRKQFNEHSRVRIEKRGRRGDHREFNSHSRKHFSKHSRKHYRKHARKYSRKHYVTDRYRYGAHRVTYARPGIHITPRSMVVHMYPQYVYNGW